ncbi:MAG: GNAT family N-acetyltransferase [Clostridiales bacterium]|nr:GNAT family N-acetyltransferase [Clostridiales bacterium]MDO4351351.1 GNAT family protein [Eubacteriales bacterium]MDY4009618.1 GNAT family protein [Candidatus Limiplasma sp.]
MRVRPFQPGEDFDTLARWDADRRAHALWCADRFAYPLSREAFENALQDDARKWGGGACMFTRDGGEAVAFVRFSADAWKREGFLAFLIVDPALRGQGVGTEAVRQLTRHAFESMGLRAVRLNVFDVNAAARRCYEKAGFTECGVGEAPFLFEDERWRRVSMRCEARGLRRLGKAAPLLGIAASALAALLAVAALGSAGLRHPDVDPARMKSGAVLSRLRDGQCFDLAEVYPGQWDTAEFAPSWQALGRYAQLRLFAREERGVREDMPLMLLWHENELVEACFLPGGEDGYPRFADGMGQGSFMLTREQARFLCTFVPQEHGGYYLCTPAGKQV